MQENEKSKKNKNAHVLKSVKNEYEDVDDYLSTFEPLLFEEVKAQIVKGRDEEDVTECKTGMVIECNEADGFHMLGILGEDWLSISQNDLLLLSRKKFEVAEGDKDVPKAYAFALVEHCQKEKIRLRMHLCGEIKRVDANDVEVSARLSSVRSTRSFVSLSAQPIHTLQVEPSQSSRILGSDKKHTSYFRELRVEAKEFAGARKKKRK